MQKFIGIHFETETETRYNRATVKRDDDWVMISPLRVTWSYGPMISDANGIEVPAGFITDLTSIPRIFRSLLPVVGRQTAPAIVHDFLYATQPCSRALADAWFYGAMLSEGVFWPRAFVFYIGVRLGAWRPWNTYAKKRSSGQIQNR